MASQNGRCIRKKMFWRRYSMSWLQSPEAGTWRESPEGWNEMDCMKAHGIRTGVGVVVCAGFKGVLLERLHGGGSYELAVEVRLWARN